MSINVVTRKDNTKRYRANVYVEGERLLGKWHKIKRYAQKDEKELKHQLNSGTYVEETNKTLNECAKLYFEQTASKKMNENSISVDISYYRNHIMPAFGHRKITNIKPIEIQELWTEKERKYASSTINRFHVIFNKIFKQMIQWGYVKNNPMEKVNKPRIYYAETDTWNKDELNKFLAHAKDFQSYIVFYLGSHTGMRMGEILGLHWSDIDFKNNIILVTKSLNRKTRKRGPLKTRSSKRAISLVDSQMDVLLKHQESQSPKSEIVCSTSAGTYFSFSNIRRAMKSVCEQAKLKKIRFHDLRHTHATLLVEAGAPVKAVSERLGHADVRITLERYTHLSSKTHVETAKRFTTLLNEKS